jgi:hypothetical protein
MSDEWGGQIFHFSFLISHFPFLIYQSISTWRGNLRLPPLTKIKNEK